MNRAESGGGRESLAELCVGHLAGFGSDRSAGNRQCIVLSLRQVLTVEENCQTALCAFRGGVVTHFHACGDSYRLAIAFHRSRCTVEKFYASVEIEADFVERTGERPITDRARLRLWRLTCGAHCGDGCQNKAPQNN